jgi:hypothetical protein
MRGGRSALVGGSCPVLVSLSGNARAGIEDGKPVSVAAKRIDDKAKAGQGNQAIVC